MSLALAHAPVSSIGPYRPEHGIADLGQHRLKDLTRPEHLHQLLIDGLDQDFPPPRTIDIGINNGPAQLTRFIGRDDEVSRIRDLVDANRLLTLTGPGGTGKTRLGLEVAAALLPSFADGVWFVDLSALTDPELVAPPDRRRASVAGRGRSTRSSTP